MNVDHNDEELLKTQSGCRAPGRRRTGDPAFKCIVVLVMMVMVLGGMVSWLLQRDRRFPAADSVARQAVVNHARFAPPDFPGDDRRVFHPGLSRDKVDRLRLAKFSRRFVESPFNPVGVRVTAEADRGQGPPVTSDLAVFIVGGMTILGCRLPPDQTILELIENELKVRHPITNVVVYDFGCVGAECLNGARCAGSLAPRLASQKE